MSSHRKRSLLFLYFPVGNSVCQLFARFTSRIPFFILRSSFLGFLLSEISKQNVNSVNRLSNSSLFVVVMFWPKTSVPYARARNDRNWREKRSIRSSLPAVMSTVVEQALVLSQAPYCDYADIVWGDQPGLKSEMEQLQAFQNRFAKRIDGSKQSSAEAMASLKWIPLARRRFGHRCVAVVFRMQSKEISQNTSILSDLL